MFDGSRLPLAQNIAETAAIAEMAHAAGVSCEGEIGFVGYAGGEHSAGTDPADASRFAAETGVDAMAISVMERSVSFSISASSRINFVSTCIFAILLFLLIIPVTI